MDEPGFTYCVVAVGLYVCVRYITRRTLLLGTYVDRVVADGGALFFFGFGGGDDIRQYPSISVNIRSG